MCCLNDDSTWKEKTLLQREGREGEREREREREHLMFVFGHSALYIFYLSPDLF